MFDRKKKDSTKKSSDERWDDQVVHGKPPVTPPTTNLPYTVVGPKSDAPSVRHSVCPAGCQCRNTNP